MLAETLRVAIQSSSRCSKTVRPAVLALDTLIYGLLLILFIIYMPKGVIGTLSERLQRRSKP